MSDAEEARRFHREATRTSPTGWIPVLAIFGLVLARAREEGSGPFFWFYVVLIAALFVVLVSVFLRGHLSLKRASPEEIRRKTVVFLKGSVATASVWLVCGIVVTVSAVAYPAFDWLRGEDLGDWRTVAMPLLASLIFLHTYFVDIPRRRRILESLPPGEGGATAPGSPA